MEFWHHRWETEQIGWHRAEFNDMLLKHWPSLGLESETAVFVPPCGGALAMVGGGPHRAPRRAVGWGGR